ncbi:MAG: RNA polymerase sigma factor [Clostridia bacterium]|nr:RNA polymerase sigma factor [Clostridia bacterium]
MDAQITELVALAQRGDADAFGRLYSFYYKEMYAYARYMVGNDDRAQDAVSDAVLSAFKQIGGLKKADAFKSWMFRILSASCKRQYTQARGSAAVVSLDDPETDYTVGVVDDAALSVELRMALAGLANDEREIILLHVFGGYKSHEIASILGLLPATVRSKQARAFKKLRIALGGDAFGEEG